MKLTVLSIIVSLFFTLKLSAQNDSLRELDIDLTNYQYSFPVQHISFESQGEKLKMAFMDIVPEKANGKVIMLLHGKNFNGAYWEQTANH